MVDANGRPHGRFPFFTIFVVVVVIGCEYFYGTLLWKSNSHLYGSYDDTVPEMVNQSVEMLLDRLQNHQQLKDQRLGRLEKRIVSLESSLRAHVASTKNEIVKEETKKLSDESREPFCVRWKDNRDEWWTHHPDWEISWENRTHYCFAPIEDREKAAVFRRLYDIQFRMGDCSKVITKPMWSSGWGADFENVVDGLKHAYDTGIPVEMHVMEGAWHYSGKKDASKPVCESKDMYCYFLPLTSCAANPRRPYEGTFMSGVYEIHQGIGRWLLEYATRQQTWLRHEVYKFSKRRLRIETPCTVMHVRRTDIVLHAEFSRKYRKIEEYVKALEKGTKNILLLTDDQNAIEEAQALFPKYNWMYIDRPRHRGTEGGWENQIPSNDPELEVIVLLSIFRAVRKCSSFIHTQSNFAKVILGEMQDTWGEDFHRVDLDEDFEREELYNEKNARSANLSRPFSVKSNNDDD